MNIRNPDEDVIKAGTTRITTASGFAAGIVVLVTGYQVVATRFDPVAPEGEETKFLIAKDGKAPAWVTGKRIEFT